MTALPPVIELAARRGWRLHPIRPRTKLPCLKDWQHRATSDTQQLESWGRQFRDCGWGAVAGPDSGFFAVDVDDSAAMQSLEDKHGPVPHGLCVITRRGYTLIYQWPCNAEVRPATKRPCEGIDIRGRDSYIVIPPSIHPSGHKYCYSDDSLPVPECPAWLLALILNHSQQDAQERQSAPMTGAMARPPIGKGGRTNHLVSLAGLMNKRGMDPQAIEAALLAENLVKCSPPLPDAKVRDIAHDIPTRYPNPTERTDPGGYELVHLGELMARPDAPVDYLVEGLLVAGTVSAAVAKPKVGKSTFARNLALAVSTGRDFLGRKTRQGEVIYLALEERAEDVKSDFRALGAIGNEPIHIHAAHAPEDAMPALVKLVRKRKPALVVIDPLFRLARIRDEKAYAETYQALGPLIDIARDSGTHILLTHHAGKSMKADAIDAPLGSTALGGIASTNSIGPTRGLA